MLSILGELWMFLRIRRKYWLIPVCVMMVLVSSIFLLAKGTPLAPLLYAIF